MVLVDAEESAARAHAARVSVIRAIRAGRGNDVDHEARRALRAPPVPRARTVRRAPRGPQGRKVRPAPSALSVPWVRQGRGLP
ncbi:hypothetical protein GCM10017559_22270 [Streptosporangium longisporum]|uniref:Uncharacterized protein n=1 Tax=Streptosporangium longisporum TaxID=46187 RepID=A0ABP6KF67_9ACTN